jgi:hypothetical protein
LGFRGVVLLSFAKNLMSFEGLELHNKLMESVNPIIVFCWKKMKKTSG